MTATMVRSMKFMNAEEQGQQLERIADALVSVVHDHESTGEPYALHDALVDTVRRERVPLSDVRYALTYAKSKNRVRVDASTHVITSTAN